MIPILYEGTETSFTSNGIGRLSDAITCEVTEKRNGAYELLMKYPIDGVHYPDIEAGRYIFAKPSKYANNQPFEIYKISKPLNGIVTICAYHISYRASKIPVMPFTADNIGTALIGLKTNSAEENPFTFSTTKTTVANYNQTEPRDLRSCLGGVQGSILDVFGGGDYEFDMFNIKLWQDRGQDRGFEIRYGKNLTDIKQEINIENTITGIVPFYKNESTTVVLPEKVIETPSAQSFPYPRTIPVDFSNDFPDSVPTEAQLRAAGNAYIAAHDIGIPKVSLDVSFVNLADAKGYENIAVLEDVRLCDTVRVVFERLGVDAKAKVISTVYNTLKEKFTKIELGSSANTLANRIAETERQQAQQSSVIQDAVERATNLITGVSGGYVVMHTNEQGKPYEILIMDNEDIEQAVNVWRWNKNGWGYSSTGYNGTYELAATIDGGIVANFIKAGTITGIEFNNGNGTFHVDSAGNMTATSATIKGTITGSTISGSSISSGISGGGLCTINGGRIDCYDSSRSNQTYISNGVVGMLQPGSNARNDVSGSGMFISDYNGSTINVVTTVNKWGFTGQNLYISGSKSRVVNTEDYGDRVLYCYETPSPMFGDIGEGQTDEDGICEVWLDDIFGETIDESVEYQVFLQKYGQGDVWIEERTPYMFKVKGTPSISFGWEVKAIQRDYDTMRLEEYKGLPEMEEDILNELLNDIEKGEDNEEH